MLLLSPVLGLLDFSLYFSFSSAVGSFEFSLISSAAFLTSKFVLHLPSLKIKVILCAPSERVLRYSFFKVTTVEPGAAV